MFSMHLTLCFYHSLHTKHNFEIFFSSDMNLTGLIEVEKSTIAMILNSRVYYLFPITALCGAAMLTF